jgi:hypothetical protein
MSESMIEYAVDVNDATAPVPLPVGEYPAEIVSAKAAVSGKGNKYAEVGFRISADAYPADFTDGDPDGTTLVYRRLSLEDSVQGRWRMKKFVAAIGAKGGRQIDLNDWVGLSATVAVSHEEYEGEKRAGINKVVGGN